MFLPIKKGQNGESLVEVLVVLVIAGIVLMSLSVMILSSLKNSQFAQNQVKATKYAQEAMDSIKTIKDRNNSVTLLPPTTPSSQLFSKLFTPDFCTDNSCFFKLTGFNLQEVGSGSYFELPEGGLSRQIHFKTNTDNGKIYLYLSVKVKWTDGSGDHESFLQTKLYQ